jgi:uncharacterized protein YbaR (Trm112 family)
MFDVFVAELRCPSCGRVMPITANTAMQTRIRHDAYGWMLGVGFVFDPRDLTTKSILDADYALIAEPPPGGPIRLLDIWICPECSTEEWAMVTIAGGRIALIESVVLTRATLDAANFISDTNAGLAAQGFADADFRGPPAGASSVDVLRRRLP